MDKENNGMHLNPIINDAWKDRLVKVVWTKKNLIDRVGIENKSGNFWLVEHWLDINQIRQRVFASKPEHFRSVEGDLQSVETVKNFKT